MTRLIAFLRPRPWAAFVAFGAAFLLIQLAHNWHLFAPSLPVYEDSDYAANSLLVLKAKRLELLHGHYSRMGFYHPGPALLNVLAAGEWLLHDQLGWVPAPHNAHMVAHLFLNAALIGVALGVVTRAVGLRTGAAAALLFLVYFAREGHLASHWFAYTFFVVYLPFQIAAASVAAGRTRHLGWLALTGGLAVHSHASFVLFAVPISLYALARLWVRSGFKVRAAEPGVRRAWILFAAVAGLFVLPIVLHTALHFPGEVGRYLEHRRAHAGQRGTAAEVSRFMCRALTNDSELGWPLVAVVAAGAAASVLTFPARGRRFVQQLAVVGALTTGAMTYYTARGVDGYENTYLGIFYGSVLLLGWTVIAMRVALLARPRASVGVGVAACVALVGTFVNEYEGAPETPAVARRAADDPRWADGPPLLTLGGRDAWVGASGLLLQLERGGKRPWLLEPRWHVLFTDAFTPDDRSRGGLWQIDAADAVTPAVPGSGELGTVKGVTFRTVETRVAFGGAIPLSGTGRLPGAKPLAGWSCSEPDRLYPVARRAVLLIDLGPCPPGEVRLALRGNAIDLARPDGHRVRVRVNDVEVNGEMRFSLGAETEQAVTFASELLNGRSPARVEFEFPDVGGPTAPGPRARPRLSVVLTGLSLTPAR